MLPSVLPRLATDSAVRVFPGVWKPRFLRLPPGMGWDSLPRTELPPYLLCLFFHLLYFSYLFLKTMICFSGCLMSSASIQKLFCGIYSALKCSFDEFVREKVVSPSYSSTILGLPPIFNLAARESFKIMSQISKSWVRLYHCIELSTLGISLPLRAKVKVLTMAYEVLCVMLPVTSPYILSFPS